jgi:hypothetical protein
VVNCTDYTAEVVGNLLRLVQEGRFSIQGDLIQVAAEVIRRGELLHEQLEDGTLQVLDMTPEVAEVQRGRATRTAR